MSENDDFDYLFKIILAGDSGVGKSNILQRYSNNEFSQKSDATVGVDFTTNYYRGAIAAVLVYDITSYKTFQNASIWIEEIRKAAASRIVILLVGNKSDLESLREVTIEEATYFAKKNKVSFIETSALNATNVYQAFENVLNEVFNMQNQIADRIEQSSKKQNIKLAKKKEVKQDLSCC